MTLLQTRALSRAFGGVHAVAGIDLAVARGEVRALIGPNGAGKTTLVGLICGRIEPDAGAVLFEGQEITALPAHRRVRLGISYTFQITSIYPRLPAAEHIRLAREGKGLAADAAGVEQELARVGLSGQGSVLAGELAYGHQRLLELAMGLAQEPALLILDEPTQGLTEAEKARFGEIVEGLRGQTTVLLIEHDMDVVMQLADTITVLDQGRVLAEGTPGEIRASRAVQAVYLGEGAGDAAG